MPPAAPLLAAPGTFPPGLAGHRNDVADRGTSLTASGNHFVTVHLTLDQLRTLLRRLGCQPAEHTSALVDQLLSCL
jgi:hypothetical protein